MPEGLEWLLELDAKLAGALDMVRALDKADASLKGVDASMRRTEDSSKKAGEGHKRHGKEAEHLEGIFHRLTHAGLEPFIQRAERIAEFEFIRRGVDALIEAPEKLIEKVKELGEEILNTAAAEERTEAAFKNLFGNAGGKEEIEIIDQIGQHTEFTRSSLKNLTLDLAQGGGFKGEALLRARAAITDIASFSKNAEEGASRATLALSRINLTGHVDARVLRGVGIGEKTYFGALSERTGKDAKSLKKAMEEGKLDTDDALEALYTVISRKTGKLLGGAGSDMEKLFSARLTHVKEIPELIFESVKDSRGFGKISDFLGDLATKFGPESEFGIAAKEGIASVFDELGDRLQEVDIDGILNKGLDVLKAMPEFVTAVGETFKDLWDAVQPIVSGFETVAEIIGKIGPKQSSKDIATEAELRNPEVFAKNRELRQQLALSRIAAKYGITREQDPETRLKKVGESSGDGMAKGLEGSADKVSDAAGKHIGGAAEEGASKRLKRHSPSKVFEDIGMDVAEGFSIGVARGGVQDAMAAAVAPPSTGRGGRADGGGAAQIVFNVGGIHIAASGAVGHEIPQQVVDKLREIVPGMLQSAFEQASLQAGSA